MRKLQKIKPLLTAAAILLVIVLIALYIFGQNYVFLCGGIHRRNAQQLNLQGVKLSRLDAADRFTNLELLDLRGTDLTPEQYVQLAQLQPNCRILWDVPFQGQTLSQDVQTLTISQLTQEEVDLLDHLPNLLYIDAQECRDYDLLLQLQQRHPDCHVRYNVPLGGKDWDCQSAELTLDSADAEALHQMLPYLPKAEAILLTGTLPSFEELTQLQETFPEIDIRWETKLGDTTLASDDTDLDLRDAGLSSIDELEATIPHYPQLTQADLRGCTLAYDEIMALTEAFPDIHFLWDVEVAGLRFPSDSEEIDISGQIVEDVADIEALLPYFPNLKKVVMCDCGVDNETMDALNRRHEDIKFVWSVTLGDLTMRTDATYFMPVKYGVQVNTYALKDLRYCTDLLCVDIGHMPVSNCEWAAYMPNLKYLIIAETQITSLAPLKDLKNLVYLELFLTEVTDISPLQGCTALEDLNMCFVPCVDYKPLFEMTWLKNLWWSGWLMRTYEAEFREALPNTRLCHDAASSTGKGWRELDNYFAMRDLLGMWYMTN